MINLEDLKFIIFKFVKRRTIRNLPKEEPLEMKFRQEVMNRLYNMTYAKMSQHNKDLNEVDIPEFAKLPEDTIKTQTDIWITKLITEDRLYEAYNDYILNT